MRPVRWLQISDFHLRASQAWAQDVVLSAMCKSIEIQRKQVGHIDFVLATGDLAFSGKEDEYKHVAHFFDQVLRAADVPKESLFCIPGNHDVDRSIQKLSFIGARHTLQSQSHIDALLGDQDEIAALLRRQVRYFEFQESYLSGQERKWTSDHLAYVSSIEIEGLRVGIVGLNSAWLAEGGNLDHGKLLVGERQVIDALNIACAAEPHMIISMAHHPLYLLNDFDRRPVQRRIEEASHFFHCGHLHDPETYDSERAASRCLTVAAGASFESRHAHNSYSIVCLDIMCANRTVKTLQYRPTDGAFSYESSADFSLVLNTIAQCAIADLALAIERYDTRVASVAYYLAALLLESQTEVPVCMGGTYAFGSVNLQDDTFDNDLKTATSRFAALRNVLRLFVPKMTLDDFLTRYGGAVTAFADRLTAISTSHANIRNGIAARNEDARTLAGTEPTSAFSHTLALLDELAQENDWGALREQAKRHVNSEERAVAIEANRKLALGLANSDEPADRALAIQIYRSLISNKTTTGTDYAALAALLVGTKDYDNAKVQLFDGIERHPEQIESFVAIGQSIIEATGDRAFRDRLKAAQLCGGAA